MNDIRRRRHAERVDLDLVALDQFGEREEVAGLAARARPDIGAIERDAAKLLRQLSVAGIRMTRHRWLQLRKIEFLIVEKVLMIVAAAV